MQLTPSTPRKALNKAYLKVKPSRAEIELFKKNLIGLLDGLDESESEEHNKNDLGYFLNNTFYHPKFYINTKDRADLVIHNGPDSKSFAGVLIEAKKPSNRAEMIRPDNLNAKAFHELILYYLRERITNHNLEIKHLVATNIYEWYVFDATTFEKLFAQNKNLVKQFTDFEEGRLAGTTTDFFYREIAEPFLARLTSEVGFTLFDFRQYDKPLRNDDKKDDAKLIALYKLLSPEHLLKLPFLNDSNTLDKSFYSELLHIIGLIETKQGSKKLIGRKKEGERNPGSLIESAITQLDSLDKLARIANPSRFGETSQERLFNVALELSITWINRILFLKLLEAQLIKYHKGDSSYSFLNIEKVKNFDDLNSLFFSVLARKPEERSAEVGKTFAKIPYLNSSLFEPTEIEHSGLFISQLKDGKLPIITSTVLKNTTGKKRSGELMTLEYLFEFLDAYDFAGEGSEEIQEENKTLINASVLGLIFEKINGYKDGSFFTPGFITMYMSRETIRRAVTQKFNDLKGWDCQDIGGLYNKIGDRTEDRKEANEIINQLKICDPAVGSGHFLVSALNEIIALKSELKVLSDTQGKRLKEYHVEVVNDELITADEDGDLFDYHPANPESQRVQEALFHEKQTIIENCLFGVDINPNSVKICRLRLWIELLKNSYYKEESNFTELETLPNIDINIKCGNSLISRYALDADIRQALKKSKWSIDSYRLAVMTYRNAQSKEEKRAMERLIESIKSDFETEVAANDKRLVQLKKLNGELFNLTNQTALFERSKKELDEWNKKINRLASGIRHLEQELEEIKNNKIYENAFEWRFEFPEVLNDEGDFVGFDVVIGNPPYIQLSKLTETTDEYKAFLLQQYKTSGGRLNTYIFFIHLSNELLKNNGLVCLIIPNTILTQEYYSFTRKFLLNNVKINEIVTFQMLPFDDAVVENVVIQFQKEIKEDYLIQIVDLNVERNSVISRRKACSFRAESNYSFVIHEDPIIDKSFSQEHILLEKICNINQAIALKGDKSLSLRTENPAGKFYKLLDGKNINKYSVSWDGVFLDYDLQRIHSCKRKDIFESNEKLLFRRVSSSLIFTYDDSKFYALNTIVVVNLKERETRFELKFLLGLLNSKLMNYIYKNKFKSTKTVFSEIQAHSIGKLPIPFIKIEEQKIFIEVSDEIIKSKKSGPNIDTTALENKIDNLVYKLYNLTEEEINIIEQSY